MDGPRLWFALCGLLAAGSTLAAELDEHSLNAAELAWKASHIHTYQFKVDYGSFIPPCLPSRKLRFKVEKDTLANRKHHCAEFEEKFGSVPLMFSFLERALAKNPKSIDVEFDPKYGYPRRVDIDWSGLTDDGEAFQVTEFHVSRPGS